MLAGFSNSSPSFRMRPVSNTLCAQDTEGFFEDKAAAGGSAAIASGDPLDGEVPATGVVPSPVTVAKGGGSDANDTSPSTTAASGHRGCTRWYAGPIFLGRTGSVRATRG